MSRSVFDLILIVGLAIFASAARAEDAAEISVDNKSVAPKLLEVKIYYESLCPDSMQFIRGQLYPAMLNNGWLEFTDLKFVPYGKVTAWTDPKTSIIVLACQHGKDECEKNALHGCIVEHNVIKEQLTMIHCLLRGFSTDVDKCASSLNVDVRDAKQCKEKRKTPDILKKYGDDTDSIDISFVPSIAMDGEFVRMDQRRILHNFASFFCEKYNTKYGVKLPHCP